MEGRRVLLGLILAAGAAYLGFQLGGRSVDDGPPPVVSAAPPADPTPRPVDKTAQLEKLTPMKRPQGRYKRPEGKNVVPFRVVEGLGVAFGDIIVGLPEDDETKAGWYDAPTPQLWDRPEIPFDIDPKLKNPQRVADAFNHIQKLTPVRFVPCQGNEDAIVFEPGQEHCLSLLGRHGGHQAIRLSDRCSWEDIVHEILHALGFVHEQSRTDRDQYVKIQWDNIDAKYREQFAMVPEGFMAASRGTPFDYRSVMLYPTSMFALDKKLPTMLSLGELSIQPSETGLSEGDVERVKRLFP